MLPLDQISLCAQACGLPEPRVRELADFARQRQQSLTSVLIERGGVDETALLKGLAQHLSLPFLGTEVKQIAPPSPVTANAAANAQMHVDGKATNGGGDNPDYDSDATCIVTVSGFNLE